MYSNPIQDATDPTIACNDDGTSGALQLTATVAAGSPITAFWNQIWPHDTGPMVCDEIPISLHKLMIASQLTYLASCPGSTCTGVDASTLKWFKIDATPLS